MKRAASVLFGKPVSYNEVFLENESDFLQLVKDMEALAKDTLRP